MSNDRTALFVIDIQKEMAAIEATRIPHADRIVDAGGKILAAARRVLDAGPGANDAAAVIVVVQHEEPPESGGLVRGTEAWEVVFPIREDAPKEYLVPKTTGDTFESFPRLAERLRGERIGKIVAFGIQSDECVIKTSKGALSAGFDVTILSGAHSTYDYGGKTAVEIEREVEKELAGLGAHVVPWEDWVATLK